MNSLSKLNAFDKIAMIRDTYLDVPPILKFILLVIATHLNKNSFAFPSFRRLMIECEIRSSKMIQKHINSLICYGLLIKILPSNGFKSNRYAINYELIDKIKNTVPPKRARAPQGGTHCAPFWFHCAPPEGASKDKYIKTIKQNDFCDSNEKSQKTNQQQAMEEIRQKLHISEKDTI